MDHPFIVLVAGHLGAFALAVAAGGLGGSPLAHRLLIGRLCAVGAMYLTAACVWADWVLAGRTGVLVGAAPPAIGAALAWGAAALGRRLIGSPLRAGSNDVKITERPSSRRLAVRLP